MFQAFSFLLTFDNNKMISITTTVEYTTKKICSNNRSPCMRCREIPEHSTAKTYITTDYRWEWHNQWGGRHKTMHTQPNCNGKNNCNEKTKDWWCHYDSHIPYWPQSYIVPYTYRIYMIYICACIRRTNELLVSAECVHASMWFHRLIHNENARFFLFF